MVLAVVWIVLLCLLMAVGAVNEHHPRGRCVPKHPATSPSSRSRPSHSDTRYYLVTTVLNAA